MSRPANQRLVTWGAVTLACIYFVVLWVTAKDVGFVRDEGYYFKAASEYGRWWDTLFSSRFFEAFSDAEIKKHFSYNTEHPALIKLVQGISHRVLTQWLNIASPSQGYRATGFFFGALSLFATFLLGRALVGPTVGLIAAALLASLPRYFFDAHLACFDVPMTAIWTLALWGYWRSFVPKEGSSVLRKTIAAGVIFGLSLATKLNAVFLPFVFLVVWVVARPVFSRFHLVRGPSGGLDLSLPRIPWVFISMLFIAPAVFVAHWPYLWHETAKRVGSYLSFHWHHEHYPALYFGDLLANPPFPVSFPFAMSFYTIPSPILVAGTVGLCVATWRAIVRRSGQDALLLAATMIPILAIAMPNSPIFGGVKHWYNAMPTLTILAARTIVDAGRAVLPTRLKEPGVWALSLLALLPGLFGIWASHPNGIGFYNELAGGFRGGAQIGMQRGFWGGLWYPLKDEIAELPTGSGVFFNRANYDSYRMLKKEGQIPQTIRYVNQARGSDAALSFEQPEHGEQTGEIWSVLGTRPVAGVYQDEVTLIQLYTKDSNGPPR